MSEAVYHEYDNLRQRYQVEAESMAQAFNRATEVSPEGCFLFFFPFLVPFVEKKYVYVLELFPKSENATHHHYDGAYVK